MTKGKVCNIAKRSVIYSMTYINPSRAKYFLNYPYLFNNKNVSEFLTLHAYFVQISR